MIIVSNVLPAHSLHSPSAVKSAVCAKQAMRRLPNFVNERKGLFPRKRLLEPHYGNIRWVFVNVKKSAVHTSERR
jgi:hypothetical protein